MSSAVFEQPSLGSPQFLRELKVAHTKLRSAMADLDVLTRGPIPEKEQVIDARWAISRASLARRTLWNQIYRHLSVRVSGEDARELQRLFENDMALLRCSSEHIGKWTITAVMNDWAGYCEASRAIRWKMQSAIGGEQRVLYPMIEVADVRR